MKNPTSCFECIMPAQAAHILATSNIGNRPVRQKHVNSLARQMKDGTFRVNGDAIRFVRRRLPNGSWIDVLVDGQHKLHACVQSGVPLYIFVVRGLDESAIPTIDNMLAVRSNADHLSLLGHINSRNLSAAINCLDMVLRRSTAQMKLSAAEAIEWIRAYPVIEEAVKRAMSCSLGSRAALAAVYTLGVGVSPLHADEMIEVMVNGSSDVDRPFNRLRERLIRTTLRSRWERMSSVQAALLIKAWNAELTDTPIKMIVWRPGNKEAFPTMYGVKYPDDEAETSSHSGLELANA